MQPTSAGLLGLILIALLWPVAARVGAFIALLVGLIVAALAAIGAVGLFIAGALRAAPPAVVILIEVAACYLTLAACVVWACRAAARSLDRAYAERPRPFGPLWRMLDRSHERMARGAPAPQPDILRQCAMQAEAYAREQAPLAAEAAPARQDARFTPAHMAALQLAMVRQRHALGLPPRGDR